MTLNEAGPSPAARPLWIRACDAASVWALLLLLGVATPPLVLELIRAGVWWPSLLALAGAILSADLVSGLIHWTCDRFFSESTPVLGRMLIRPFREHHRDPLAITRHDLFELCGNNALAVLPLALPLALAAPPATRGALLLRVFALCFALAVFATNLIHKWAHQAETARGVRWLQVSRLILSPAAHARHHRGDFSRGYCVTTGWANPLLDACRVLPRCEAVLRRAARGPATRRPVRDRRSASTCTATAER